MYSCLINKTKPFVRRALLYVCLFCVVLFFDQFDKSVADGIKFGVEVCGKHEVEREVFVKGECYDIVIGEKNIFFATTAAGDGEIFS